MREILFRGKRIDNGECVYGYYICKQDPLLPGIDTNVIVTFDENSMSVWNKTDPYTIGQYTGLTDKNSVKIFEGDIIQRKVYIYPRGKVEPCGERLLIGTVIWCHSDHDPGYWTVDSKDEYGNQVNYIFDDTFAVVGNAHDNPELLEEAGQCVK